MVLRKREKKSRCLATWLTAFVFFCNQIAFAAAVPAIELTANRETPGFLRVDIPADLASLDGLYEAPPSEDSRVVLHIQNAHANYEAQQKIKKLLEYLRATYDIKTVFVEGAAEDLNPDYFRFFPDEKSNLELADRLAKKGELTGAELYLLAAKDPGVEGKAIEDAALYRQNYEALKTVFGAETLVNHYLAGYESQLEKFSSKIFTNDIRKILAEWKKFEKGHREFIPFVNSLVGDSRRFLGVDLESLFAQVEWPQITRLLVLQGIEKDLDTAKALRERDKLLEFLQSKKIAQSLIEEVRNFKDQRVNVRQGKGEVMAPRDVLEALVREAGPKGFYFRDYPSFSLYAGYLILKSELDSKGLFEEVKRLFDRILQRLAETPHQKALLELYQDSELVRKLLGLELTRQDWQEAVGRRDLVGPERLISRLRDLGNSIRSEKKLTGDEFSVKQFNPKLRDPIAQVYDAAFRFYDFARRRESIFYEKIDSVMKKSSIRKAVLITGGFHTDGMTDLFRQHAVSYGVLMPRFSEAGDESLYRKGMLQSERELVSISYLEMVSSLQSLSEQDLQGTDLSRRLATIVSAFREKLPTELSGEKVAESFNGSPAARANKIRLEYKGKDSGEDAKDHYVVHGLEALRPEVSMPAMGVAVTLESARTASLRQKIEAQAQKDDAGKFRKQLEDVGITPGNDIWSKLQSEGKMDDSRAILADEGYRGQDTTALGASMADKGNRIPPTPPEVYSAMTQFMDLRRWEQAYQDYGIPVRRAGANEEIDVALARIRPDQTLFLQKLFSESADTGRQILFFVPDESLEFHPYVRQELEILFSPAMKEALGKANIKFVFGAYQYPDLSGQFEENPNFDPEITVRNTRVIVNHLAQQFPRRAELREDAAEIRNYAGKIEDLTSQISRLEKQLEDGIFEPGKTADDIQLELQGLYSRRLDLAKEYVDVAVGRGSQGNPLIAKVTKAYLDHYVQTDVKANILAGGHQAQRELMRIREIARFENKSLTAGWMGSPDKESRHDKVDALILERRIIEKLVPMGNAALYSDVEAELFSDSEAYWRKDTRKTEDRISDAYWNDQPGENIEKVLREAATLDEVVTFLLEYIAQQAGLVPGHYEMGHRAKSLKSTRDKIAKMRTTWKPDVTTANLFDLIGGRFIVPDLDSLMKLVSRCDELFGFKINRTAGRVELDPSSPIVRKENKYVANSVIDFRMLDRLVKAGTLAQEIRAKIAADAESLKKTNKVLCYVDLIDMRDRGEMSDKDLGVILENADPYRAIQYTISFPPESELVEMLTRAGNSLGKKEAADNLIRMIRDLNTGRGKDATALHTFELQLKTERVAPASDFVHEIGFKPNIEGMAPFVGIVNQFSSNALYDDYFELARLKAWEDITQGDLVHAKYADVAGEARTFVRGLFQEPLFAKERAAMEAAGKDLEIEMMHYEQAVFQAIVNSDIDRFFDLVLSWYAYDRDQSDWSPGVIVPNPVRDLIIRLVRLSEEKLIDYKNGVGVDEEKQRRQMERIQRLEAAANKAYMDAAVVMELTPQGAYLGTDLSEDAVSLLPPAGQAVYRNRYRNVRRNEKTGAIEGFNNKTTASQLGLTGLSDDALFAFFRASGKNIDTEKISPALQSAMAEYEPLLEQYRSDLAAYQARKSEGKLILDESGRQEKEPALPSFAPIVKKMKQLNSAEKLIVRIMLARKFGVSEDSPVINLFHEAVGRQYGRLESDVFGAQGDPETRVYADAWRKTLTRNQLGTVVSASILTEMTYGPVVNYDGTVRYAANGKPVTRDLMATVVSDENRMISFSLREMLINWIFMTAIRPNHKYAHESYQTFALNKDNDWDVTVDKAMDHAVARALIEDQLEVLRGRIGIAEDVAKVAIDIRGASALASSRELIETYFRTIGVDSRILARWMAYLDMKYAREIDELLTPGNKLAEAQKAERQRLRELAGRSMDNAIAAVQNMHTVFQRLLERVHERQAGQEDILLAMMPFMNLTYADLREMAPEGAIERFQALRNALIEHGVAVMQQASVWLEDRMNGPIADATGIQLTRELLGDQYITHLSPLLDVLGGSRRPGESWNKATWEAYQDYSNNQKNYREMDAVTVAGKLAEIHSGASVRTLEHMIVLGRLSDRVGTVISSTFPEHEKVAFALAVHNQGYAAQQMARTASPSDLLLPVEVNKTGAVTNTFMLAGEDLLTDEARKVFAEYNTYASPGKKSIPKLSLAGFKLTGEGDVQKILKLFTQYGKRPEQIFFEFEIDQVKQRLNLPDLLAKALPAESPYRKILGNFEVFNAFVRNFDVLVQDAKNYKSPEDYQAQLAFLNGKQTTAIAYVLLLSLMPQLLNNYVHANTPETKAAFVETMNRAVNAMWRVTSPWEDWKNPLIPVLYWDLDPSQQVKDTAIWDTVLRLSLLMFDRLSSGELQYLEKLERGYVYSREDIRVGAKPTAPSAKEFMAQKIKDGYYFIGVVTASGKGIASDRVDNAKANFKDALRMTIAAASAEHTARQRALGVRDIKPLKFIVVSGGTGNWNPAQMSGVDLAYDAAKEMGLETMGIYPEEAFKLGLPIRNLDYQLPHGERFGDESRVFVSYSQSMIVLGAGEQGSREVMAELQKMELENEHPDPSKLSGMVVRISGIPTARGRDDGSHVAVTDSDEIKSVIVKKAPNAVIIDQPDQVRPARQTELIRPSRRGNSRFVTTYGDPMKMAADIAEAMPAELTARFEMRAAAQDERFVEIAQNLETANRIRTMLDERGVAVLIGAPGTGKTELSEIAVGKDMATLDMPNEFWGLRYAGKSRAEQNRMWAEGVYYREKSEELSWISDPLHFRELLEKYLKAPGDVVMLDEIDLSAGPQLDRAAFETSKLMMQLAAELKKAGKKVIVVVHPEALRTPGFLEALRAQGLLEKETDIIRTGYFSPKEETDILGAHKVTATDAEAYRSLSEGVPAAYMGFLKYAAKVVTGSEVEAPYQPTLNDLTEMARESIGRNYRAARLGMRNAATGKIDTMKMTVVNLLDDLATGLRTGTDPEVITHRDALLDTGLVKADGEGVRMPRIVRETIDSESLSITPPEGQDSVLLPLSYPVNLTGVRIADVPYYPKWEVHATLFFRTDGVVRKIMTLTGMSEDAVRHKLEQMIREVVSKIAFRSHRTGDYAFVDKPDGSAHTIVEPLIIEGFDEFYTRMGALIKEWTGPGAQIQIPRVYPHTTLLQAGALYGIGVTSKDQLRSPVNAEEQAALATLRTQMRSLDGPQIESSNAQLDRLVESLRASGKFGEEDLREIGDALAEAMIIHRAQKRREGSPYFGHLVRVVERAVSLGVSNPYVIQSLALHDALEDQPQAFARFREQSEAAIRRAREAASPDAERMQARYDAVVRGVRILSKKFPTVLDGVGEGRDGKEAFQLKEEEYDGEYLRQLVNPRNVPALSATADWFTDDYIRQLLIGKSQDFGDNLIGNATVPVNQGGPSRGYLNKTQSFINTVIMGTPYLGREDQRAILNKFLSDIAPYSGMDSSRYPGIADTAGEVSRATAEHLQKIGGERPELRETAEVSFEKIAGLQSAAYMLDPMWGARRVDVVGLVKDVSGLQKILANYTEADLSGYEARVLWTNADGRAEPPVGVFFYNGKTGEYILSPFLESPEAFQKRISRINKAEWSRESAFPMPDPAKISLLQVPGIKVHVTGQNKVTLSIDPSRIGKGAEMSGVLAGAPSLTIDRVRSIQAARGFTNVNVWPAGHSAVYIGDVLVNLSNTTEDSIYRTLQAASQTASGRAAVVKAYQTGATLPGWTRADVVRAYQTGRGARPELRSGMISPNGLFTLVDTTRTFTDPDTGVSEALPVRVAVANIEPWKKLIGQAKDNITVNQGAGEQVYVRINGINEFESEETKPSDRPWLGLWLRPDSPHLLGVEAVRGTPDSREIAYVTDVEGRDCAELIRAVLNNSNVKGWTTVIRDKFEAAIRPELRAEGEEEFDIAALRAKLRASAAIGDRLRIANPWLDELFKKSGGMQGFYDALAEAYDYWMSQGDPDGAVAMERMLRRRFSADDYQTRLKDGSITPGDLVKELVGRLEVSTERQEETDLAALRAKLRASAAIGDRLRIANPWLDELFKKSGGMQGFYDALAEAYDYWMSQGDPDGAVAMERMLRRRFSGEDYQTRLKDGSVTPGDLVTQLAGRPEMRAGELPAEHGLENEERARALKVSEDNIPAIAQWMAAEISDRMIKKIPQVIHVDDWNIPDQLLTMGRYLLTRMGLGERENKLMNELLLSVWVQITEGDGRMVPPLSDPKTGTGEFRVNEQKIAVWERIGTDPVTAIYQISGGIEAGPFVPIVENFFREVREAGVAGRLEMRGLEDDNSDAFRDQSRSLKMLLVTFLMSQPNEKNRDFGRQLMGRRGLGDLNDLVPTLKANGMEVSDGRDLKNKIIEFARTQARNGTLENLLRTALSETKELLQASNVYDVYDKVVEGDPGKQKPGLIKLGKEFAGLATRQGQQESGVAAGAAAGLAPGFDVAMQLALQHYFLEKIKAGKIAVEDLRGWLVSGLEQARYLKSIGWKEDDAQNAVDLGFRDFDKSRIYLELAEDPYLEGFVTDSRYSPLESIIQSVISLADNSDEIKIGDELSNPETGEKYIVNRKTESGGLEAVYISKETGWPVRDEEVKKASINDRDIRRIQKEGKFKLVRLTEKQDLPNHQYFKLGGTKVSTLEMVQGINRLAALEGGVGLEEAQRQAGSILESVERKLNKGQSLLAARQFDLLKGLTPAALAPWQEKVKNLELRVGGVPLGRAELRVAGLPGLAKKIEAQMSEEDLAVLKAKKFDNLSWEQADTVADAALKIACVVHGILQLSRLNPEEAADRLRMLALAVGADVAAAIKKALPEEYLMPVSDAKAHEVRFVTTESYQQFLEDVKVMLIMNPNYKCSFVFPDASADAVSGLAADLKAWAESAKFKGFKILERVQLITVKEMKAIKRTTQTVFSYTSEDKRGAFAGYNFAVKLKNQLTVELDYTRSLESTAAATASLVKLAQKAGGVQKFNASNAADIKELLKDLQGFEQTADGQIRITDSSLAEIVGKLAQEFKAAVKTAVAA